MYSRYTPNERGGFERRAVPDAWEREAEDVGRGSGLEREAEGRGAERAAAPIHPGGHDPPRPRRSAQIPPYPPPRPGAPPPGQPSGFPIPGLFGPEGLLNRVLPRAADAEELLILAVLLLSMKQDGADGTELLIAAALYLLL